MNYVLVMAFFQKPKEYMLTRERIVASAFMVCSTTRSIGVHEKELLVLQIEIIPLSNCSVMPR
jgi:hypothetical protein